MTTHPYAGDGQHTTSYYAASANPSPDRPALTGAVTADVCVVGAGYSGLSTALHLAEKGHSVIIIEGARVGWGASGRNGGQIVNGLNASLQTIRKRYGQDTATFVAGIVQEGGEIIRERVATLPDAASVAVMVADHWTGEVLAHLGSPGLSQVQRGGFLDMTRAMRSPGSTLKPLIYGLQRLSYIVRNCFTCICVSGTRNFSISFGDIHWASEFSGAKAGLLYCVANECIRVS